MNSPGAASVAGLAPTRRDRTSPRSPPMWRDSFRGPSHPRSAPKVSPSLRPWKNRSITLSRDLLRPKNETHRASANPLPLHSGIFQTGETGKRDPAPRTPGVRLRIFNTARTGSGSPLRYIVENPQTAAGKPGAPVHRAEPKRPGSSLGPARRQSQNRRRDVLFRFVWMDGMKDRQKLTVLTALRAWGFALL